MALISSIAEVYAYLCQHLLGVVLAIWKWLHSFLDSAAHDVQETSLAYGTTLVKRRLEGFDECPIQMTPMLEPVRIIHEDEDAREGQPAHIMDLPAANRWLFGEAEARCPFCRGAVLRVQAEPSEHVESILMGLAEKSYTNSETVAHKAVRLRDARLLSALSRLPAATFRELLLRKNQQGQLPLDLAAELMAEELSDFLEALHLSFASAFGDWKPILVRSSLSAAAAGGCDVWSREDESDPRPVRPGDRVLMTSSSEYVLLGHGLGGVILLRYNDTATLCTAPLPVALCKDGKVPEVYECGLQICLGRRWSFSRKVTIGGSSLDDVLISGLPSSAVAVHLEESIWRVEAAAVELQVASTSLAVGESCTLCGLTDVTLPPGQRLTLRPCYLVRRATSRDLVASLQEQIPRDARQRVVLVRFQLEQSVDPARFALCGEHIGAISSDFTVGRRLASSLVIPMAGNLAATVSRHHCCIHLQGDELMAYDAGSLSGTQLNGQALGCSLAAASKLSEGDVLDLGKVARLRLAKVSPVLRVDDDSAMAAFLALN